MWKGTSRVINNQLLTTVRAVLKDKFSVNGKIISKTRTAVATIGETRRQVLQRTGSKGALPPLLTTNQ
ncbi:hypothetical protein QUB80_12155 [Chlorogloeopsis sp. ULAP01]|nr:hypothetical protein [Chlorogloeopsis sp. ULAP01]